MVILSDKTLNQLRNSPQVLVQPAYKLKLTQGYKTSLYVEISPNVWFHL
jgi:hypothetical protein